MPLQQTSGAASYDAFGGGAPVAAKYIEDFFQTWLRTGTGSSTTVTTGLNASINKSLVWTKSRSAATNHKLTDTARGVTKALSSNTTGAEVTDSQGLTAFSSTGYTIGTNTDYNNNGATYVDWQWVATPKFFDVVTWTGTGSARTIAHNLGSTPGCIIVKQTSASGQGWAVYHRSEGQGRALLLNDTAAAFNASGYWNSTAPTDTVFSLGSSATVNESGQTYVAYLFAHNAGGFGLTGTDNVISCGSFTTDSIGIASVTLGYEPQWLMVKRSDGVNNWTMKDVLRGSLTATVSEISAANLRANTADAESTNSNVNGFSATATGFYSNGNETTGSATYIYIAIRRGPMRTPTIGTSVFLPQAYTGNGTSNRSLDSDFVDDFFMYTNRTLSQSRFVFDRLRGNSRFLQTNDTSGEALYVGTNGFVKFNSQQNGAVSGDSGAGDINTTGVTNIGYHFRRAPGFFDEICFDEATAPVSALPHNLTVAPELVIYKKRSSTSNWATFNKNSYSNALALNLTDSYSGWGSGATWSATSSTVNLSSITGGSGTAVAYLFASCPGVSKVGSYTGTGTTQLINCGFTGGARFVLIKRTDSTGDWYVWDSARGIVSGNDPYLLLNSTAAEVTNTDFIDTASTGFEISSTAPAAINANGGTFIFLAIA